MSQIHTGLVGTSSGRRRVMTVTQLSPVLWEIRFSDTDQVFTGRTCLSALSKAIEYRRDARIEIGDSTRVKTATLIEHLMGVRR